MSTLAADLVRSLFCGLPRWEKRMTVFLSASDETCGEEIFHHGGYVAPLECWTDVFVPSWEKLVLAGPPRLEEFHITELRSRMWREKNGITKEDAEARIDSAVNLISQTKGMFAVRSTVDGSHFGRQADGLQFQLNDSRRKPIDFVVDYPSFHGYVYLVMMVCSLYPKAEKVDFVVEKKREVFPAMRDFHQGFRDSFTDLGYPRIGELVGELIPGDKKKVPLQAADLLCWHYQRLAASAKNGMIRFSEVDRERLFKLTRMGAGHTWEPEMIEEMCGTFFEDWRKLNEVEGVREVQSDNEYDPPRRPESGESCDGSAEES